MLINALEGDGKFNTNGVAIKSLNWNAVDRFFLNFSRKNLLESLNFFKNLEKNVTYGNFFKNKENNLTFFKNSDHSDTNR